MLPYIIYFDYIGVALFAATGALSASRQQLDLMGFFFLATLTGIGGGTIRDLILDVPVFWIANQTYFVVCLATALLVYFTAHLIESRYRILLWLDAVALAVYGVFGAFKSLNITDAPFIAIFMGVVTGTVGGILRDVLTDQPNAVTRKEIYITAALVGAAVYVGLVWVGLPRFESAAIGAVCAFAVRAGTIIFGWTLPPYRGRPGRDI